VAWSNFFLEDAIAGVISMPFQKKLGEKVLKTQKSRSLVFAKSGLL